MSCVVTHTHRPSPPRSSHVRSQPSSRRPHGRCSRRYPLRSRKRGSETCRKRSPRCCDRPLRVGSRLALRAPPLVFRIYSHTTYQNAASILRLSHSTLCASYTGYRLQVSSRHWLLESTRRVKYWGCVCVSTGASWSGLVLVLVLGGGGGDGHLEREGNELAGEWSRTHACG